MAVPVSNVHTPLASVVTVKTSPLTVTSTWAPGSLVPVSTGVVSAVVWVLTVTAGATLSRVRVWVACVAALPATSLTLAVTATGPLAQVLMSAICAPVNAQVPPVCTTAVTVLVCVALVLSVSTTVTI